MKVIISAGGTGGHIYPALAIINKIKEMEPNSQFLYIGTHNRMEKDIIPNYNIPFKSLEVFGFSSKNIFKNVKTLNLLIKAEKKCEKIIKEFNPDIVIGVGGYVSAPVIRAAHKLKYPTLIHEQNSIPGKANKFLTRYASKVAVSFASSSNYFPKSKVVITGNPCSSNAKIVEACDKKEFGLDNNKKLVLIVMGSLGSSKINNFIIDSAKSFAKKDYEVLFITGKENYESVRNISFPNNVKILPYVENLTRLLKRTDVIVSRAGASTLSEILALRIPSILIPSPYVPNNHQYKNALDMVNANACILLEEKDLTSELLIKDIDLIILDKEKTLEMKKGLASLDTGDSATNIYNCIKKLVDRK